MKFENILIHLREGKKIRRNCWPEECYLCLIEGQLNDEDGAVKEIITDSIFLDDWELYEEKEEIFISDNFLQLEVIELKDKLNKLNGLVETLIANTYTKQMIDMFVKENILNVHTRIDELCEMYKKSRKGVWYDKKPVDINDLEERIILLEKR